CAAVATTRSCSSSIGEIPNSDGWHRRNAAGAIDSDAVSELAELPIAPVENGGWDNRTVGGPSCDLTIAWTFLDPASRAVLRKVVALDSATWKRARGWAMWKARSASLFARRLGRGSPPARSRSSYGCTRVRRTIALVVRAIARPSRTRLSMPRYFFHIANGKT